MDKKLAYLQSALHDEADLSNVQQNSASIAREIERLKRVHQELQRTEDRDKQLGMGLTDGGGLQKAIDEATHDIHMQHKAEIDKLKHKMREANKRFEQAAAGYEYTIKQLQQQYELEVQSREKERVMHEKIVLQERQQFETQIEQLKVEIENRQRENYEMANHYDYRYKKMEETLEQMAINRQNDKAQHLRTVERERDQHVAVLQQKINQKAQLEQQMEQQAENFARDKEIWQQDLAAANRLLKEQRDAYEDELEKLRQAFEQTTTMHAQHLASLEEKYKQN